ncbi:TRAP transporter substrate-binding protein DctP [Rhodococcus sp. BP-332]|uniref:TRAP transporter substrate-binding protein n=1 Tax=Rhodococcus sp. BP-332 TaxID=2739447 RepID=UPI001C9ABCD1|nr:TRAP transporter substrate-binding protein DctP [Rhodococcus sp. BP-332]MBY6679246.1 TRAP transporter substrate-binding protein DctP [Rhodococcus sp. BP-332]
MTIDKGIGASRRRVFPGAACLALVLSASACAEHTAGNTSGGAGVESGTSQQEYVKAFEAVAPITLEAQSAQPQGTGTKSFDDYFAALEDWSGGKVTINHAYSSSRVEATDVDAALGDGRLDIAVPLTMLKPQEYPRTRQFNILSTIPTNAIVPGTAGKAASLQKVGLNDDGLGEEYERAGMKSLMPFQGATGPRLFCTEERTDLDDFAGVSIAAQGIEHSEMVEALGASHVSLPFTEYYEALQRGVVDCVYSGVGSVATSGILDVAPFTTDSADANVTWNSAPIAMSADTWDALPLVAQQLLWDRVDVLIASALEQNLDQNLVYEAALAEAGGSALQLADDAVEAMNRAAAAQLARVEGESPELVEQAQSAARESQDLVAEYGFGDGPESGAVTAWFESADLDPAGLARAVYESAYLPLRPE